MYNHRGYNANETLLLTRRCDLSPLFHDFFIKRQPESKDSSMAAPSPPNIHLTIGALFVGVVASAFLFGIATLQTYTYYDNYPKDRRVFKYLVGWLWIADLFHAICIAHAAYHYAISNYFNPKALIFSVWSLNLGPVITAIIACTCQAFFTSRVWILGRNYIVTTLCVALCIVRLGLSIVTSYGTFHEVDILTYEAHFSWSIRAGLAVATAGDVVIASALVYYLSRNRTGFAKTDRIISRILTFTVETCVVTSTVTVIDVICFATMPDNFVFLGLYFLVSKLYSNSLLTSLNNRNVYRTAQGTTITVNGTTGRNGQISTLPPMFRKQTQLETEVIAIESSTIEHVELEGIEKVQALTLLWTHFDAVQPNEY
ncbi:hypothetical protein FB45DRAFT_915270 [Roridomyces roridus]|uniref:DUF6534 domain-containing protein n=1 Tax=Roridomyces roridus TaxID=1738132 RepID=A0AAD7BTA8_9AGAR|nr:hypothetical protein FB45DRAFT_915270 [Roridomyces roridus]